MKRLLTVCASVWLLTTGSVRGVEQAVPRPPSAANIKACIKQIDLSNQWPFTWKALELGTARHPQNNYEALAFLGGQGRRDDYGYPVHVAYNMGGLVDIDSMDWLIRDAEGHWMIPAVCRL